MPHKKHARALVNLARLKAEGFSIAAGDPIDDNTANAVADAVEEDLLARSAQDVVTEARLRAVEELSQVTADIVELILENRRRHG